MGVHDHIEYSRTCQESLDMTYQCVVKIMKTPTAKNYAIVKLVNKQLLLKYLLKFPSNDNGHHLTCFH